MEINVLLKEVLECIIQNALPMVLVYWILERPIIVGVFENLKEWVQENLGVSISAVKRYITLVLAVLVSTLVYVVYAKLGYAVLPLDFEGWANLILSLGAINFTGTQLLHAKDLKRK